MRILGLCLLMACCTPLCVAQQAENRDWPDTARATPQMSERGPADHPVFLRPAHLTPHLRLYRVDPGISSPVFMDDFSQPFCAYLRTYRVRRDYQNSDVVRPSGYATCIPAKRWELRTAVETQRPTATR